MATVTRNDNGVAKVIENLNGAMGRRKDAALVICKRYGLLSKQLIQQTQGLEQLKKGKFWTNQTSRAIKGVYGFAVEDKSNGTVGFGLAHHVEYGKYLELAHNREHAALEETVKVQVPFFMDEIQRVFSD
jgi:hypothetical protein